MNSMRRVRIGAVPCFLAALWVMSVMPASAAVQTQMAMSGDMEVDVLRADVKEGVLTVQLLYRNTGNKEAHVRYPVEEVYYIDLKEKKKYHVLKDSKGEWIAAPVARSGIGTESGSAANPLKIAAGGKQIVWFKFPAPPDAVVKVNLVVPNVVPFEDLPITR